MNNVIENFNFVNYISGIILSSVDKIHKILLTEGISFTEGLAFIDVLSDKLSGWRNVLCDTVTTRAEQIYNDWDISITKMVSTQQQIRILIYCTWQEMQYSLAEILQRIHILLYI